MAGGVNKVILIGHLGKDPEVRYTPSGQAVANFTLATTESWTDKQGQRQDRTEWHRIVVWGKTAELAGEYLSKGRQVYVEGKLQTRQWDDQDGNKKSTTEIVGSNLTFLGARGGDGPNASAGARRNNNAGYGAAPQNNAHTASPAASNQGGGGHYDYGPAPTDDDVPFHHLPRRPKVNF